METQGGDQLWVDRFMAQHAAIVYYWVLVVMYLVAPQVAYNFSELIESHAVDTYGALRPAAPCRALPAASQQPPSNAAHCSWRPLLEAIPRPRAWHGGGEM